MPNIKSAKKRVLVNATKNMQNKIIKSELKTVLKKADAAITENSADKKDAYIAAIKKLDQACAKGIYHKNTVSRKKSNLTKKYNTAK